MMLVPKLTAVKTDPTKKYSSDSNDVVFQPNCSPPVYNILDQGREYAKYIKLVERLVRTSIEYKAFIKYLKAELNLTKCTFLGIDLNNIRFSLEMHHYPFTLYDITATIVNKYIEMYGESAPYNINKFNIANEILELHYKGKVGLVPLSKTAHEAIHNGAAFINFKYVSGNYEDFYKEYKEFMSPELIDNYNNLKDLDKEVVDLQPAIFKVKLNKLNMIDINDVPINNCMMVATKRQPLLDQSTDDTEDNH